MPRAPNLGRLYRFERRYGTFSRTVGLPQGVAESDVHADCKNGVLKVDVRRPEQPKPKRIQLSSGAGGGQTGEEVTPSPEEAPDDGPTWDRPLNRADVSASVGVASDPTVATFWSGVRREEGPFAPRVSGCGCLPQQGGEASSTPIDFCPDHPGSESPSGGFGAAPQGSGTCTTDTNESQAALRLRLAVVEAAIDRVSSDRLRYAELIKDLEDLRGRLLAALDELSAD